MSDVLVVVSKMKKYIKDKAGMNTAASATAAMTKIIEHYCDKAIEKAKAENRKTVMDRDLEI